MLIAQSISNFPGAVTRVVVNDENVWIVELERKDLGDDGIEILRFVVGGQNDERVHGAACAIIASCPAKVNFARVLHALRRIGIKCA